MPNQYIEEFDTPKSSEGGAALDSSLKHSLQVEKELIRKGIVSGIKEITGDKAQKAVGEFFNYDEVKAQLAEDRANRFFEEAMLDDEDSDPQDSLLPPPKSVEEGPYLSADELDEPYSDSIVFDEDAEFSYTDAKIRRLYRSVVSPKKRR